MHEPTIARFPANPFTQYEVMRQWYTMNTRQLSTMILQVKRVVVTTRPVKFAWRPACFRMLKEAATRGLVPYSGTVLRVGRRIAQATATSTISIQGSTADVDMFSSSGFTLHNESIIQGSRAPEHFTRLDCVDTSTGCGLVPTHSRAPGTTVALVHHWPQTLLLFCTVRHCRVDFR